MSADEYYIVLYSKPKASSYDEFFDNNGITDRIGVTVKERQIILPTTTTSKK